MEESKFKNENSKLQIKTRNFIFYFSIFTFAFCILNFLGCSSVREKVKEGAKQVWGTSTKPVEESRKDAVRESFAYDYSSCYDKSLVALKDSQAYIYAKDKAKKLIAVYISEEDTTPVGIFFTELDATHTQIEVSSPSTFAKESIATKLFSRLVIALNPVQVNEPIKEKEGKKTEAPR